MQTIECAEGEQPRESDVTYLLAAAPTSAVPPTQNATTPNGAGVRDATLVVFCVDVSGSMAYFTEVDQVGQVSRLRAAQAALMRLLESLKQMYPNRRVALIAFEERVHIHGDGLLTYELIFCMAVTSLAMSIIP